MRKLQRFSPFSMQFYLFSINLYYSDDTFCRAARLCRALEDHWRPDTSHCPTAVTATTTPPLPPPLLLPSPPPPLPPPSLPSSPLRPLQLSLPLSTIIAISTIATNASGLSIPLVCCYHYQAVFFSPSKMTGVLSLRPP